MRLTALLFLLFISSLNSQSLTELFYLDLPEKVLKNELHLKQVELNLENITKINPELVYFYSSFLEEKYGSMNKELAKKISNEFTIQKDIKIREKYESIMHQRNLIKTNENNTHYRNVQLNYTEDFIPKLFNTENESRIKATVDENKLNYFVFKFHSRKSDLTYDPNSNYQELRNNSENRLIEKFQVYFENLKNNIENELTNSELIKEVFDHWYLFQGNLDEELQPYKFIKHIVNTEYKSTGNDNKYFMISFGYSVNKMQELDHRFGISDINYSQDYSFPINMNHIFISVTSTLPIFESKTALSNITLELSYLKGIKEESYYPYSLLEELPPVSEMIEKEAIYNLISFENEEIKLTDYNRVGINLTFPILYVTTDLSINIGGSFFYDSFEYVANYNYSYIQKHRIIGDNGRPVITDLKSGNDSVIDLKEKTSEWVIGPNISLNYNLLANFFAKVSMSDILFNFQFGYAIF